MWVVFITATIVAIVRWEHDYHLFLMGVVSFTTAFIARNAMLNHWKYWSIIHVPGMSISYIFLLIAFYVDNGRFLPFWKDIDPIWYWLSPITIGTPIMIWSVLTNPFSRHYFKK